MLEAVGVFGIVIFVGMLAIFIKLPPKLTLRMLAWPLTVDVVVTVLVLWMHWGTMTGLMSATVAGIVCAIFTTAGRAVVGYIDSDGYHPGFIRLRSVS